MIKNIFTSISYLEFKAKFWLNFHLDDCQPHRLHKKIEEKGGEKKKKNHSCDFYFRMLKK